MRSLLFFSCLASTLTAASAFPPCLAALRRKDAGTSGTFGPNLDEIKPNKALVLKTIKAGPGAMPSNLFTGAKADAVASYVSSVAGQ